MSSPNRQAAPPRRSRPARRGAELEIRQLEAFVGLVEEGSLTAVAKSLGLAQSTVSEALSALERSLGARVAARRSGARGAALTPAGQALLPHARAVLAALQSARRAVASADRASRGRVEVVANESISTYLLSGALARLRAGWPRTRFAVTVGTCPSVREGVSSGRFDLGLLLESEEHALSGGAAPLASVALLIFSRPDHPLAPARRTGPREISRDELAPYPVFVSDASGDFQTLLDGYFRADGLPGPPLDATGSIEAVKRSVRTGPLALGVLPDYALAEELRAGNAVALPVRPAPPRVTLCAIPASSRPLHPAAAELVEMFRAAGSREPARATARGRGVRRS